MSVKIEIKTDGYTLPEHASLKDVMSAEIKQLEDIQNALEREKSKVEENLDLLDSIYKSAKS